MKTLKAIFTFCGIALHPKRTLTDMIHLQRVLHNLTMLSPNGNIKLATTDDLILAIKLAEAVKKHTPKP